MEVGSNLERFEPGVRSINVEVFDVLPSRPLKDNIFSFDTSERRYNQFDGCDNLATVDLVGAEGIHCTISSLLLESWRYDSSISSFQILMDMVRLMQYLCLWIRSVLRWIDHFKTQHNRLLKHHVAQLELAIWKAKLDEKEDNSFVQVQTKRAKIDVEAMRKEKRITSGASMVIKNVLPFLKLV